MRLFPAELSYIRIYAVFSLNQHCVERRPRPTKKKRLTLNFDPPVQRRLKAVAARKGIGMRRYCRAAIDKELARDEANGAFAGSFNIERLVALQEEAFGDEVLPADAAALVREARDSRSNS